MNEMTPLMKQYWEIKNQHSDKILFFRMGDFFELFYEDAVLAAPLLGLTLTQRNKKAQDETPMCGLPHHAVASPINKLLSFGYKVAICDQLEDPKLAKGIVKRGVTRILTPGMVFDPDSLDSSMPHYMGAFEEGYLALMDPTTGEAFYIGPMTEDQFLEYYHLFPVAEWVTSSLDQLSHLNIKEVSIQNQINLPLGWQEQQIPRAAQRLITYAQSLVGVADTLLIQTFHHRKMQTRMQMNPQALRHLEIFQTYKGEKKGSFQFAIDKTLTAMGGRLLRDWLSFPLTDYEEIKSRQSLAQQWMGDLRLLDQVRDSLKKIGDVERRLARVASSTCNARDILQLTVAIEKGQDILKLAHQNEFLSQFLKLFSLANKVSLSFVEEPPQSIKNGYMIRLGVDPQLDEWIHLSTNVQSLLLEMEQREKEKTQIPSLKIRYNNVFGYYIEVTHTHKEKVPSHYMRKQTLAQAERYCTEELIEIEKKVLSAESKRFELEYQIFDKLRKELISETASILLLANHVALIDVYSSSAQLALESRYNFPEINTSKKLYLESCRHPVVEKSGVTFTPNTISMEQGQVMLITGPNMAGKSTLMRQVALNVLLAQMGFPVACQRAQMPIFDSLFTRIGASDELSQGLSTFMVEMKEASFILKNIKPNSLLIIDEIGRGTSTYDGLSLAQSILEFILKKQCGFTFFATHYHELTNLESQNPSRLFNVHMGIEEKGQDIYFLHTLKKGPAMRSYGIHVGRLAGLPEDVIKRSKQLLKSFEQSSPSPQLSLFESFEKFHEEDAKQEVIPILPEWVLELNQLNLNEITPLGALQKLFELKKKASDRPPEAF